MTISDPLEDVLRRLGAKLSAWQVRALYLGAHASADLELGPQHLLPEILGDAEVGEHEQDARENLGVLLSPWNELTEAARKGVRLSTMPAVTAASTVDELRALAERRAAEIDAFMTGLGAGGDLDDLEPDEQPYHFLATTQSLLEGLDKQLARWTKADLPTLRATLSTTTSAIEDAMTEALRIGATLRREQIAELRGQVISKPKPGRNEPCPCGSGRKWKRCCGAAS